MITNNQIIDLGQLKNCISMMYNAHPIQSLFFIMYSQVGNNKKNLGVMGNKNYLRFGKKNEATLIYSADMLVSYQDP
jgi:hypothetical protein